jgi:hypothetical protein
MSEPMTFDGFQVFKKYGMTEVVNRTGYSAIYVGSISDGYQKPPQRFINAVVAAFSPEGETEASLFGGTNGTSKGGE